MTLSRLLVSFFLILSPWCVVSLASNAIRFRVGKKRDELAIATTLAKELMNPLFLSSERFVVAEDVDTCKCIGFAQIRPLGSAQRDPSLYDSRPGSYNLELDLDDAMWDKFEGDETPVPAGWASLPWTKEYRAFEEASKLRRARREEMVKQRQRTEVLLWELASVYVEPPYRSQGIGTELVRRVLQRHVDAGKSKRDVYLLTLATTAKWYADSFNFEIVPEEEVPAPMSFEMTAGKIITKLIGAKLCCMRGAV
jgi:GNAT superfamily N-acetyltransferase